MRSFLAVTLLSVCASSAFAQARPQDAGTPHRPRPSQYGASIPGVTPAPPTASQAARPNAGLPAAARSGGVRD